MVSLTFISIIVTLLLRQSFKWRGSCFFCYSRVFSRILWRNNYCYQL